MFFWIFCIEETDFRKTHRYTKILYINDEILKFDQIFIVAIVLYTLHQRNACHLLLCL